MTLSLDKMSQPELKKLLWRVSSKQPSAYRDRRMREIQQHLKEPKP